MLFLRSVFVGNCTNSHAIFFRFSRAQETSAATMTTVTMTANQTCPWNGSSVVRAPHSMANKSNRSNKYSTAPTIPMCMFAKKSPSKPNWRRLAFRCGSPIDELDCEKSRVPNSWPHTVVYHRHRLHRTFRTTRPQCQSFHRNRSSTIHRGPKPITIWTTINRPYMDTRAFRRRRRHTTFRRPPQYRAVADRSVHRRAPWVLPFRWAPIRINIINIRRWSNRHRPHRRRPIQLVTTIMRR